MAEFSRLERVLSCPYFVPIEKNDAGSWLYPSRLPLGAGFSGHCSAPGHEGALPTDDELRELCNLGYATNCHRLPEARACDAVRFSVSRENGKLLTIWYVCETGHRPTTHGMLQYDGAVKGWRASHADAKIQKLAECFVHTYLAKKIPVVTEESVLS